MAAGDNGSPLAPTNNGLPERVSNVYEVGVAPAIPGMVGPEYFEEGLATDPSVPQNFVLGIQQGIITAPGRPNHNQNVYEKWPAETMQARQHAGAAAWTEAPEHLGAFAGGSSQEAERRYIQVTRSGGRQERRSPAIVND